MTPHARTALQAQAPAPPPAAAAASPPAPRMVSRDALLSALIHAALHGARTIAALSDAARRGPIALKEAGDARSALTLADTAAQRVIVSSLLGAYPALRIVGEEDDSVQADAACRQALRADLLEGYDWTAPLTASNGDAPPAELALSDVVVFVDPLDGTREFVEGRLGNVQTLIGLCYRGRPVMGAVGLPFPPHGAREAEAVFGLVGKGIGKVGTASTSAEGAGGSFDIVACPVPPVKQHRAGEAVSVSSGDSAAVVPAVDLAARIFPSGGGIARQRVGATGHKLLRVAYGDTTLSLLHDMTSLWDTAAPTALLAAMGGRVTDYFGEPLVYQTRRDALPLGNTCCVVASAPGAQREHLAMVKALRGDGAALAYLKQYGWHGEEGAPSSAQCVDLARDLDGHPLTAAHLARATGAAGTTSYSCPEATAVRGMMSNACRVRLAPSGRTFFYKRIVFERLAHARANLKSAPHKLLRDVKSYEVETSFLGSKACKEVIDKAGLRIPKCYDAQLRPASNPIESKFSVLLEDFAPSDGWTQRWLLQSTAECEATLTTLAKMHAFFWQGAAFWDDADAAAELEDGVWAAGGYAQPQLQTLNQCTAVAKGWATHRLRCRKELEVYDFWEDLGTRLESVAEENGRLAQPFAVDEIAEAYKQYRTFTHGDPKQANLFFRATEARLEVGLIDFQWGGFGLAATDVAHFVSAAVQADLLENGGEAKLLRHYYDELQRHLVGFGAYAGEGAAAEAFGFDTFLEQYETAFLDMCRLVVAYAWSRFEAIDRGDAEGCARTMNKNSYNKSLPNVTWMMSRCDQILKSRGV